MDSLISSSLDEICSKGQNGLPISSLWPVEDRRQFSVRRQLRRTVRHVVWKLRQRHVLQRLAYAREKME
ncbi:hypothetical protein LWI29_007864 [Acer saccharum]|uniref:General transcription factor 3C polypeptide 1 winged-helix domain-containing protein n=1 Tax=Acer saccharum TaxID=4024 RepID=A0AA39VY25_ACESA|nr:hypothetical protein LWI29_007864 [Acer saccharum]